MALFLIDGKDLLIFPIVEHWYVSVSIFKREVGRLVVSVGDHIRVALAIG